MGMFDNDISWEDTLDDELIARVGDRQVAIREEAVGSDELGGIFDIVKTVLDPREHIKQTVGSVQSLARGDIKGALDPSGILLKQKEQERRRRAQRPSTRTGRTPAIQQPRPRPATRPRPSPAARPIMARAVARPAAAAAAPHGKMMLDMMRILSATKTGQVQKAVGTPGTLEPHLDKMARKIEANLDPKLKEVNSRLRLAGVQRSATSEHNAISKRDAYRRRVLKLLAQILKSRPKGDPMREQAVRVLGNVLGPAGMVVRRPR